MMQKRLLDFNSAYAQLILLVFLPIVLLAGVGAYLVEKESSKAIESEQRTLATAALIRYEPLVKKNLPILLSHQDDTENQSLLLNDQQQINSNTMSGSNAITDTVTDERATSDNSTNLTTNSVVVESQIQSLDDVQNRISTILSSMSNDQHIQRVAVIDEHGKVLASSGQHHDRSWVELNEQQLQKLLLTPQQSKQHQGYMANIPTLGGTAYGHLLGKYEATNYWLFVDMDNEPLIISQLKVWLGLAVTSLFTLLLLLLSLNIYAKRWIAPIYDLRLHLQQITTENMYLPIHTASSGELNQLQQDLLKTLRRLYGEFQELKDYSDQTEADLRDAFDEMEMQNIFIREARDQAVSSSQAKSAFLANISHELRTPLNSIDGFINLLARHGELTAEQDLYVQTIRKSSAHLLALVNDVLDFSKIEAGKLVLDKHEFSLYSVIYDVMDMLSPLAAEKGLRMAVMYYNDVPNTVIGDALRVKQILTNLVGNAIKFTDVGEVVVRVAIDDAADNVEHQNHGDIGSNNAINGMIHIAIQDTGHGVSEQVKSHLFKSFSQGDPSITRQYGGTGLGLVICKQLTRLMGGQIGFYDNDDGDSEGQMPLTETVIQGSTVVKTAVRSGVTFWFTMPAHVDMDIDSEAEFGTHTETIDDDEQMQLPILRPFANCQDDVEKPFEMLVWINHTSSMQVFMAAIRPLKINVTIARSLAGALEKLKEEGSRWDWVIIDGVESEAREDRAALLKQIRLHYQGKLAIYGYQVALDTSLLERYKALGLYQPLDKRQLYRMMDTRTANVSTMVAPPTWQGVTVLAVDDHLPNLLVLDALLSELGIQVVTASNGYDAVDIISKQLMTQQAEVDFIEGEISHTQFAEPETGDMMPAVAASETRSQLSAYVPQTVSTTKTDNNEQPKIDLIFMDVQMPRMSGDEAAKKIRQLEADTEHHYTNDHKRIPIIALTAHGLADGKDKLIAAGMDDYVGKPISRPQLLQILQRWLGRGGDAPNSVFKNERDPKDILKTNEFGHPADAAVSASSSDSYNMAMADKSKLPAVDWSDALIRSANRPDLAKQLLFMMQESIADEVTALEKAWQARDREALAQIAHRILGASRYSGVPQIREASQNLEDKCLLNVQHTVPAQFNMLQEYYATLITSLQVFAALDLDAYIAEQMQASDEKALSENDMTWKMI